MRKDKRLLEQLSSNMNIKARLYSTKVVELKFILLLCESKRYWACSKLTSQKSRCFASDGLDGRDFVKFDYECSDVCIICDSITFPEFPQCKLFFNFTYFEPTNRSTYQGIYQELPYLLRCDSLQLPVSITISEVVTRNCVLYCNQCTIRCGQASA